MKFSLFKIQIPGGTVKMKFTLFKIQGAPWKKKFDQNMLKNIIV